MIPTSPDWNRILADDSSELKPVSHPQAFAAQGGWSGAKFWRWAAPSGLVLCKVWPFDGPSTEQHLARHQQLINLNQFQPVLALPLANRKGETLRCWPGGQFAELCQWVNGEPVLTEPDTHTIHQVVDVIARLHAHWRHNCSIAYRPSPALTCRLSQLYRLEKSPFTDSQHLIQTIPKQYLSDISRHLNEICRLANLLIPSAIKALQQFEHRLFPLQTVLRDARPDHFLFIGDKLNGVIDFGAIGTDTVSVDLARLCSEWFPSDQYRWDTVISYYNSINPMDEAQLQVIEPLALAGAVLGGLAWLDLHFRKKRTIGRMNEFERALNHALERLHAQFDLLHHESLRISR